MPLARQDQRHPKPTKEEYPLWFPLWSVFIIAERITALLGDVVPGCGERVGRVIEALGFHQDADGVESRNGAGADADADVDAGEHDLEAEAESSILAFDVGRGRVARFAYRRWLLFGLADEEKAGVQVDVGYRLDLSGGRLVRSSLVSLLRLFSVSRLRRLLKRLMEIA